MNTLRKSLESIEQYLSESTLFAEDVINDSLDDGLLHQHLEQMLQSVKQNMVDEEELTFLREASTSKHQDAIAQILHDIDDFEFELAEQHISALLETLK